MTLTPVAGCNDSQGEKRNSHQAQYDVEEDEIVWIEIHIGGREKIRAATENAIARATPKNAKNGSNLSRKNGTAIEAKLTSAKLTESADSVCR